MPPTPPTPPARLSPRPVFSRPVLPPNFSRWSPPPTHYLFFAPASAGWQLNGHHGGISADGTVIAGYGLNPAGQTEAWIATIPEPATDALMALLLGPLWARRR